MYIRGNRDKRIIMYLNSVATEMRECCNKKIKDSPNFMQIRKHYVRFAHSRTEIRVTAQNSGATLNARPKFCGIYLKAHKKQEAKPQNEYHVSPSFCFR